MDMPASRQAAQGTRRREQRERPLRERAAGRVRRRLGLGRGEPAPARRRVLSVDATRTIIARNNSPDIGFDRSINPYRGCEHGCIYCYARPSHAYLGLSPGLDFETRIFYKPQAAALLKAELCKKGYTCRPIALGSNTDPYQPAERRLGITRAILEVLRDFRHPVTIVTKGALIQRDLDILGEMARDRLAVVTVSVTTLDRDLARHMEPRAATPERRLETIAALAAAGRADRGSGGADDPGAQRQRDGGDPGRGRAPPGRSVAGYTLLRLPLELKALFKEWLEEHAPQKAAHVLSLVAQCHGGRLYDSAWSKRMTGGGPYAEMLAARFDRACRRLGFAAALDRCARHRPLPSAAATGRPAGTVLMARNRCAGQSGRACTTVAGGKRRRAGWRAKDSSTHSNSSGSSSPLPRSCANCRPT